MRFAFLACLFLPTASFAQEAATLRVEGEELNFRIGNRIVALYKFAGTVGFEKDATKTKPLAKPYFFPLIAPNGVSVTRPWPLLRGKVAGETTDHFHQKSAWFCHGDVIPEGLELKTKSADKHVKGVDFWSEAAGHGRIVTVTSPTDGTTAPGTVGVTFRLSWDTADEVAILDEERTLKLTKTAVGYRIDLESKLTPTKYDITFGDTKEGSMGIRIRDEFRATVKNGGGTITSADGTKVTSPAKDNLPLWGKLADWHDYSGTVDGKIAGIAIFDHPKNLHRAAWHTRAYGLMAANPFARSGSNFPGLKGNDALVKLKLGESLTLRYAMYIHDGDAGNVAAAYAEYVK